MFSKDRGDTVRKLERKAKVEAGGRAGDAASSGREMTSWCRRAGAVAAEALRSV